MIDGLSAEENSLEAEPDCKAEPLQASPLPSAIARLEGFAIPIVLVLMAVACSRWALALGRCLSATHPGR